MSIRSSPSTGGGAAAFSAGTPRDRGARVLARAHAPAPDLGALSSTAPSGRSWCTGVEPRVAVRAGPRRPRRRPRRRGRGARRPRQRVEVPTSSRGAARASAAAARARAARRARPASPPRGPAVGRPRRAAPGHAAAASPPPRGRCPAAAARAAGRRPRRAGGRPRRRARAPSTPRGAQRPRRRLAAAARWRRRLARERGVERVGELEQLVRRGLAARLVGEEAEAAATASPPKHRRLEVFASPSARVSVKNWRARTSGGAGAVAFASSAAACANTNKAIEKSTLVGDILARSFASAPSKLTSFITHGDEA